MNNEKNQLMVVVEQSSLDLNDKQSLLNIFTPYFNQADEWTAKAKDIVITDASQIDLMQQARQARLMLKDIRVNVEKTRKQLKEDSLRKGKAIDGIANVIKYLVEPVEDHLEKQEKFVEIQERQRLESRKEERVKQLVALEVEGIEFYDLLNMNEDNFQILVNNSTLIYDNKIELRKKAEAERIAKEKAELEERERIRKENEKLKAEKEIREKELAKEREKIEKEKEELRIIAEKEKKKLEAAARKAQEEKARAEAELRAKEEIERKKKEAEKEAARQAKLAPEKDKLIALAKILDNIEYPSMDSDEGAKLLQETIKRIKDVSLFITKSANKL